MQPGTQRVYRNTIERLCEQTDKTGKKLGNHPAALIEREHIVRLMTWAQGILTFKPGMAALIADVNPIFKLHLFLGMTILLVFPFTRLVNIWSVPFHYLGGGRQIVRGI